MSLTQCYSHILAFVGRHERPLGAILFVAGFITDLITFNLLPVESVSLVFAVYLAIAIVATLIAHATHGKAQQGIAHAASVLAPLAAQFVFGSVLSGFLIFYTKSAALAVSWPFIILLSLVFIGNEYFRTYRSHLIYQSLLVYFSLYAFLLIIVPLRMGEIGQRTFLVSTGLTLIAFALYVAALASIEYKRLSSAIWGVLGTATLISVCIVGSYMAGVLPPIPLALKDGGVYEYIERSSSGEYIRRGGNTNAWFDPRPQRVIHQPGTPLYAYSAIFAPGKLTTNVVHVWERYDDQKKSWHEEATISFPVSGGRANGYRGYSLKSNPQPGKWRVLVQTVNGQTIGTFSFTVVNGER